MAVKHFFGTLKGQFRKLKLKFDVDIIEDALILVMAACILHNLAILNHEEILVWLGHGGNDDNDHDDEEVPDILP